MGAGFYYQYSYTTSFNITIIMFGENLKFHYEILSSGLDFDACKRNVLHFFQTYQLVRYAQIKILKDDSLPASSPEFWDKIEKAILENRLVLKQLLKELEDEGITTLKDLEKLPQGYKSTMLHTATHFLDGFFGVDTYFYNLVEDSHWVSRELTQKMQFSPAHYWLLALEAES